MILSNPVAEELSVTKMADDKRFIHALKTHQAGKTTFATFREDAPEAECRNGK